MPKNAPKTESKPQPQPTDLTEFQPQDVTNPAEFFRDMEVCNPVQLEEGKGFQLPFLGSAGEIAMPRADGETVDYIGTWRFRYKGGIIRVMGSKVLDRELESIEERYTLDNPQRPCLVAVWRQGTKDIGKGRTLTMYRVGVAMNAPLKPRQTQPAAGPAPQGKSEDMPF